MLAEAISADDSGTVRATVTAAARTAGRAASDPDLSVALRACGYEPATTADGEIELRNCPFHQVARRHTDVVCGLNLHLVQGILDGSGQSADRAVLAPRPGRCCVRILGPGRL